MEQEDDSVLNLGKILRTLWRGKILITLCASVFAALAVYYVYFMATPIYQSTAVIMLNNREEQVVDLQSVVGGLGAEQSVINTELEVLRSRNLLGKVVDRLALDETAEFNRLLRDPSLFDRTRENVKDWIGVNRGASSLTDEEQESRNYQAAIDGLKRRLSIRNVPQSLVFEITLSSTDAKRAALIANTIAETYIANQVDVKLEATDQATEWLASRVAELQIALEEAESDLKLFRAGTDLISPEVLVALENQRKDLRDRIADTEATVEAARARLAALEAAATPVEQVAISGDTQLEQYLARLDQADVAQLFSARYAQITGRTEIEIGRNDSQLRTLQRSAEVLSLQIEEQSSDLIRLQQLIREAEATSVLYEYFLTRFKETSAQQGIHQADSRIISSAIIPISPSEPNKSLTMAIWTFMGLALGGGLVLIREVSSDTFQDASSLEHATNRAVIGQIPLITGRSRKDTIQYLIDRPTSAAAESVRNMRTSVLLSHADKPPRVIMMSSSLPGEGKTTLALALAQNLSAMGRNVLFIEGDVRRKILVHYLHNDSSHGIADVASGAVTLEEAVFTHQDYKVDILQSGESQLNAADLFSSKAFSDLIKRASQLYDNVIIDTAPVLLVPDARIIAQYVDALVLAVRWNKTRKDQVLDATDEFESIGAKVTGFALNGINFKKTKNAYASYGKNYYTN